MRLFEHAAYPVTLIPALFLLLASKWHNRFFVWIGSYAYSIYLFHGFGTSGGRIILKMMGIDAIVHLAVCNFYCDNRAGISRQAA